MKQFSKVLLASAIAATAFLSGCTEQVETIVEKQVPINQAFDPALGLMKFTFNHTVNGQPFQINKSFTDASGNTYQFNEIRYWVSNIQLTKANGETVKLPDTYYLVENRDTLYYYGTTSASTTTAKTGPKVRESFTVVNVPLGDYTKVKYAIGVDPTYNNNFALKAGELDVNQMSQVAGWAWQTSYIFLRTKGTFVAKGADPLSAAQRFVIETGGNEQYREVEVALNTPISSKANQISELKLTSELMGLFKGLPAVAEFKGTKPSGWAADPNLTKYDKFINAGSLEEMKKVADNTKSSVFALMGSK